MGHIPSLLLLLLHLLLLRSFSPAQRGVGAVDIVGAENTASPVLETGADKGGPNEEDGYTRHNRREDLPEHL